MPAIITDQYRILNAETFVDSFVGIGTTGKNNYYTFLGHPRPADDPDGIGYGDPRWAIEPPNPVDNFNEEIRYHDSMLFLKKITSSDVRRVIPRINWQSGTVYEMYRNNYSSTNRTSQTATSSLYGSSYYIVTSEFKVYLCINNGTDPENDKGRASKFEPTHTSTTVPPADNTITGDGYQWKYLYTISPSDIVKFVTSSYIPLPEKWGDVSTKTIKDAAVDGKLETIVIKRRGTATVDGLDDGDVKVPIIGDGNGETATVKVRKGVVSEVLLTNTNSSGYTYAHVRFVTGEWDGKKLVVGNLTDNPQFEVIIPPQGGHGADIYRELGGFRVMVYSKFDNNINDQTDYIVGNDFSRVGIVKNPKDLSGTSVLNKRTATSLGALKLRVPVGSSTQLSNVVYKPNARITQYNSTDSSLGIGTAVGYVASWDSTTGVLRYYQPVGFSTGAIYGYELNNFVGVQTNTPITGATHIEPNQSVDNLVVDSGFNGESISVGQRDLALGQSFTNGVSDPEIKKYSGEIIYIDNRAPITRTASQKEEVKIVIEF